MSGQSVLDRVTAAKHTITGSDLAKSVCKATTAELMGPKKKHLDYLLQCTLSEHINIPELADLIIERTTHANWVVVYKALSTCHHLMIYGHERFIQYLATRTVVFSLGNFMDKTYVQGYDMSSYIRRYSEYLNQKALSYRTVAFDFCRVKRGKEEGKLRTMAGEKLLKTLPILQNQMDALLECEISQNDLTNGVINGSFMLLFKDVIRLFACYNDGIINLLEKFFDMTKKDCKLALDIYKKFLTRMERVAEFLKVAERVGIDKGEIPDLAQAPSTLLEALEAHLASLDSKKLWTKPASVASAVSAFDKSVSRIDSQEKRMALEEEKQRLAAMKIQQLKDQEIIAAQEKANQQAAMTQSSSMVAQQQQQQQQQNNNPFLSSPTTSSPVHQQVAATSAARDIFGTPPPVAPPSVQGGSVPQPARNDLIGLTPAAITPSLHAQIAQSQMAAQPQWGAQNGLTNNNDIGANFDKVFSGNMKQNANSQELFGDILQPMSSTGVAPKPMDMPVSSTDGPDLDTTLSKLATNISLDIRGSMSPKKSDHQWNKQTSMAGGSRTGGAAWQPVQMASTTWPQQPPGYGGVGARPVAPPPSGVGMYQQGVAPQAIGGVYQQQQQQPRMMQPQSNDPFGNL